MKSFRYCVATTFAAAVMIACAGNPGPSSGERCALAAADTVYLATGPVYRDCAVDVRARIIGQRAAPTDYRPTATPARGDRCIVAEVQFVVDPQGVPEAGTARVVRADDPGLGEAVLRVLPQWRYSPAQKDGSAVRQIVRERSAIAIAFTVVRVSGSGGGTLPPPPPPSTRPSC